jgi:hypothetical protein
MEKKTGRRDIMKKISKAITLPIPELNDNFLSPAPINSKGMDNRNIPLRIPAKKNIRTASPTDKRPSSNNPFFILCIVYLPEK